MIPVKKGACQFCGKCSQPVRLVSIGIGEKILLPNLIIGPIGDDRVLILILSRHRLRGL